MNLLSHQEAEEAIESIRMSTEWGSDGLDFSSDVDMDSIKVEDGGVQFSMHDSVHAKCVDKQVYDKEKQTWEDAIEGLSHRFSRSQSMMENLKAIVLQYEKRIEQLDNEKTEALQYKDLISTLEKQASDLNDLLVEANRENAQSRIEIRRVQRVNEELEEKLFGPVNYYYQEFKKIEELYHVLQEEKTTIEEQLRQVKDIMRSLIADQYRQPTIEMVHKERESFARQVGVFERRIEELEEENRKLSETNSV